MSKILGDCRDIAIHRLLLMFNTMLGRVGEMLMDRASRTDVREDQVASLDARDVLRTASAGLMAEFERRLRKQIDDCIAGKVATKTDFSKVDAEKLSLIDTHAMDESVLISNITRVVENLSHDELQLLNRGVGHLLGDPALETGANPFAPAAIVSTFADALETLKADHRVKHTILKEINQASLAEVNSIYADLNKHLQNLHVMPKGTRRVAQLRREAEPAREHAPPGRPESAEPAPSEIDVMALFQKRFRGAPLPPQLPPSLFAAAGGGMAPPGGPAVAPGIEATRIMADGSQEFPAISLEAGARYIPRGPLAPTPSGYVPGLPIIATPMLGEGLARLQAGESDFDLGAGTYVQFSGIPEGRHNVLRDLQESPLGKKANQLELMTIELVAMLFDFIFETKDLPDGIKALLARLQIPVLKAAMLDGAFFAKKSHPSRLLVNALAEAGRGWSPAMGTDDPLYQHIDAIVHRILDGFTDNLAIFDEAREKLEKFLADEEKVAEANIQSTAEEIDQTDRREMAVAVARAEVERRIQMYPVPNFLATFLRQQWAPTLENVYMKHGEESDTWEQSVAMLEDLVWSVQPKRTKDDRKHLVALLPSLLKRLSAALLDIAAAAEERDRFMANLVEAHAASVKPAAATAGLGTASVVEQAKAAAEQAHAAGDEERAAKAEELAAAMTQAEPAPVEEEEVIDDQYLEIAQSLERGAWIEFEADDGQLAFAKLAWISPLRGTYLFTNRQGLKALSMNAEELAARFREDRARLVEAEPLIDRALGSVIASFTEKMPEPVAT
ncbi:MAG TPA: DUF1631 family protein [Casimicrobiaceae bacterium]|nr:DUF1631 family protein [Casimicrobiaceae bacterium]